MLPALESSQEEQKPVKARGQTDVHIKLAKQKKKGEAFCFFEYGKQFRESSHLKK